MESTIEKQEEIELTVGGTYITDTGDIVQIRKIDTNRNEYTLYNITDGGSMYIPIRKGKLVKRIR